MSELIKAVVSIKDPFALLAFFAVVLLMAFRTRTVPESLFGLVREKITRDRFYTLLNRSLLYGFAVFLVLCGTAVLGQVLDYMTTARAASVEELKQELALRHADDTAARQAIEEYQKGLALAQDEKLSEAIASLESSLKAVPTTTARETLALLYQKAGNSERATQLAQQAVSAARETGGALNTAKAERLLGDVSSTASNTPAAGTKPDAAKIPGVKMPDVNTEDACCGIVANPALKGRLGRLVLAFPQGANAGNTRTYVYKDKTEIARFDGNKTLELLPGTYAVAITGKRVEGVTIQSGHETTVKVGLLRVTAGNDTRIYLLDTDQKRELARGDGTQELGFPIGTVYVNVAGQSEAVTIQEGKITEF